MQLRYKIIIAVVALLVAFGFGRYSVAPPDVTKHETTNETTNATVDKDTHKTTTTTKKPDGTEVTTTTEDIVEQDKTTQKLVDQLTEEIKSRKNIINISALAGLDFPNSIRPVYGVSANKEFIGPLTVGAFGLTNGVIGVSVGINF